MTRLMRLTADAFKDPVDPIPGLHRLATLMVLGSCLVRAQPTEALEILVDLRASASNASTVSSPGRVLRLGSAPDSADIEAAAGVVGTGDWGFARSAGAANAGSLASATRASSGGVWGPVPSGTQFSGNAMSLVRFKVDDMMITGAGNSTQTSVNLFLSGSQGQNAEAFGGVVAGHASANLSVTAKIHSTTHSARKWFNERVPVSGVPFTEILYDDPLLAGPFPGMVTLGPFTVSLNSPFTLEVSMYTFAVGQFAGINGGSGIANAQSDYGSTLYLPTTGPVFNLDTGLTASSVEAGVVDNTWTGTPVSVSIPEPGSASLLATGLIGVLAACWRIRRAATA